jgi:hypothetical protein
MRTRETVLLTAVLGAVLVVAPAVAYGAESPHFSPAPMVQAPDEAPLGSTVDDDGYGDLQNPPADPDSFTTIEGGPEEWRLPGTSGWVH